MRYRNRPTLTVVLALLLALTALAASAAPAFARSGRGQQLIYTLSNDASGNAVLVYQQDRHGLTMLGSYPTGGAGNGAGLGSQGAVVLNQDRGWLFAVNAGSNEISAFRVTGKGLKLTSTINSGGEMPISVTVSGLTVYALNAGGAGNISGFRLDRAGRLVALPNSTRPLSASGVGPAQVSFTPDGTKLVVTEKATNRISVYLVDHHGMVDGPVVSNSAGPTPFGFDFDRHGNLIVSEAAGGAPDASSTSSYRVNPSGSLTILSAAVPTHQTAACWVVVTENGRFAYTTNTGSGSVSGYRVLRDGSISLDNATAGLTGVGSTPIDAAIADGYLYVLNAGTDSISVFKVRHDGSLTHVGEIVGLPATAVGLAAI